MSRLVGPGLLASLFPDAAFGAIRWPRTLGRPLAPTLAEGFRLKHQHWAELWHVTIEGVVTDYRGWVPAQLPPVWWDAADDGDHYRVNYFVAATAGTHELDVEFTRIRWERSAFVNAGYRWLDPVGHVFEQGKGPLVLPDFEVRFHGTGPQ